MEKTVSAEIKMVSLDKLLPMATRLYSIPAAKGMAKIISENKIMPVVIYAKGSLISCCLVLAAYKILGYIEVAAIDISCIVKPNADIDHLVKIITLSESQTRL